MKVVKMVLIIVIAFLLSLFIIQNLDKTVDIKFFTENNVFTMEFVIALLITLIFGIIIGLLFAAVNLINTKSQLRTLKKEYLKLEKEVNLLRNKEVNKANKMKTQDK
ncbi:MAG: LapA family protein [Fidelibacterota bacterium]